VVTVEGHTVLGGLGSAVTDTLVEGRPGAVPPIKRLGIHDAFAKHYGSQDDLMETRKRCVTGGPSARCLV
jgi:transketolase